MVGLVGILLGLALLIAFAYRGWSVLLLAPAAALVAAGMSGEPLLAHWTNTFMIGTAGFVAQFFPIFLLGSLFGKLMEDSGSVSAIARFVGDHLGARQAILAVVLVGALVTYGGVNLMVAFFVIAPMAQALFQDANIPRRLMPAAIGLGTFTFTMSALPGSPAVQNAIPIPHFGTTPFAAPGLGIMAAVIMLGFGLWWLRRAEDAARSTGEGFGPGSSSPFIAAEDEFVRETATHAGHFDPAELSHGHVSQENPTIVVAALPLVIVLCVNLIMSLLVLPRLDVAFLAEDKWGGVSLAEVAGVWSVVVALAVATVAVLLLNLRRLPALRQTVDAGANASVLPILSVASLVGFGAVVAALPAFEVVKNWVLSIGGGPLVSLAASVNILAALTGSASGGMTIALGALGDTYLRLAAEHGIDPALMHRVAVIGSGTLDALPHNGAVVTLLSVCGTTHQDSYSTIIMAVIAGPILALIAVIAVGSALGSF
jgi:H+/gluconate symporter-like permease